MRLLKLNKEWIKYEKISELQNSYKGILPAVELTMSLPVMGLVSRRRPPHGATIIANIKIRAFVFEGGKVNNLSLKYVSNFILKVIKVEHLPNDQFILHLKILGASNTLIQINGTYKSLLRDCSLDAFLEFFKSNAAIAFYHQVRNPEAKARALNINKTIIQKTKALWQTIENLKSKMESSSGEKHPTSSSLSSKT